MDRHAVSVNCRLATFCEELLPMKQTRNNVLLRHQQSTSLQALHSPQNYKILRFCIKCTYVLYFVPHKTVQVKRRTLKLMRSTNFMQQL